MAQHRRQRQQRTPGLGGIAAMPMRARDPIAQLGPRLAIRPGPLGQADAADYLGPARIMGAVGLGDQEMREIRILRLAGKPAGLCLAIGPGHGGKIAGHRLIAHRGLDGSPILRPDRAQKQVLAPNEHRKSSTLQAPASSPDRFMIRLQRIARPSFRLNAFNRRVIPPDKKTP